MSPAVPTAQARALTLATAARALGNKPVTSRILELSMPELQTGNRIPFGGSGSWRCSAMPLTWMLARKAFCKCSVTKGLHTRTAAGWEGGVYHSPAGPSANSSSGPQRPPRAWACQPAQCLPRLLRFLSTLCLLNLRVVHFSKGSLGGQLLEPDCGVTKQWHKKLAEDIKIYLLPAAL